MTTSPQVIEIHEVTKRFGETTAVERLTFDVHPGVVTGFLGPNGAGKTTTMRLILGLNRPTSGTITIGGRRYRDLPAPLREVGAVIDAQGLHPRRTARHHLLALARSNRIPGRQVGEVLHMVGLDDFGHRRIGAFSTGMRQRLSLAAAMLGDPPVLVLDEPVNGLDPEGIIWVRGMMRRLAAEGRTVLVSSHLMSEMSRTADRVIVLSQGRLLRDQPIGEFVSAGAGRVLVRGRSLDALLARLREQGAQVSVDPDGAVEVVGAEADQVGELAAQCGAVLHELSNRETSLEEAFVALTNGDAAQKVQKVSA